VHELFKANLRLGLLLDRILVSSVPCATVRSLH